MRRDLKNTESEETALQTAVRILGRAAQTTSEVRLKLLKCGYDGSSVEEAVTRLREMGYLNDESYAREWVEKRQRVRPASRLVLRQELRRKGIDSRIADSVLSEIVAEDTEVSLAEIAAEKWIRLHLRQGPEPISASDAVRLARHLRSRGFDSETIQSTIDHLASSSLSDEQQPD